MRGEIKNKNYKTRIIDATGVRYGAITMTDLDAYFEFGNRLSVFVEIKYNDVEPQGGQRLALTRLVDDIQSAGKKSLLIVATYYHQDGDLVLHTLPVRSIYTNGHWHCVRRQTVKSVIDNALIAAGMSPRTGK